MSLQGSIADARELYSILEDIENKINEINTGVGGAGATVVTAKASLADLKTNFYDAYIISRRLISVIRRFSGGNADIQETMRGMSELLRIMQLLNIMIMAMMASTPWGWMTWLKIISAGGAVVGIVAVGQQNISETKQRR